MRHLIVALQKTEAAVARAFELAFQILDFKARSAGFSTGGLAGGNRIANVVFVVDRQLRDDLLELGAPLRFEFRAHGGSVLLCFIELLAQFVESSVQQKR